MAAKAGPAHDWPNSGPLPASWKRSDQAGRVFFVHRGRELERDVALIGFRQRPLAPVTRSEEHTSELQSLTNLVCRLLLEKKKKKKKKQKHTKETIAMQDK